MDKLDSSPFPDDLREELTVQPARTTSKVTLALGAGVVLVAGILIGIQAQNMTAPAGGPPPQAAAAQRPMGGGGYGQQQPGGRQRPTGGGGTAGTVEKVQDGKVYVRTQDGATVTVTTTEQTTVQISKPGKVTDLEKGTSVVVRGQQGADGAVTATSISQGGGRDFQGGGPR
ncbi:hypothetical protein AB0I81_61360 [Nonomuraea sp. NPDC050404]|uniref:hypothetical protein n=1 Tax=Nonomuraea sp. NPDC050404 TaxID=3155783 RepID=UPI0033D90634